MSRADYIRSGLLRRGLPQHVADAFMVNFRDESGLNPGINEAKPMVPGSRGGFGLYQLTGSRRTAYEGFARNRGVDPSDIDAQLDFMMGELSGSEKRAGDRILSSKDTAGAAQAIVTDFLRPSLEHRNRRAASYAGLGGARPVGPGAQPLQNVLAEREMAGGAGQSQVMGGAGDDTLSGSPTSPMVEIGLSPEQKRKAAGYEAITDSGMKMGQNARNVWDVAGGLAQVWAGTSGARKLEEGEHSELVKAYAARGLTPDEQVIASAKGGREGLADVLTARKMNEIRTAEHLPARREVRSPRARRPRHGDYG